MQQAIKTPDVFPMTTELVTGVRISILGEQPSSGKICLTSLILCGHQCWVKDFYALWDILLGNALGIRNEWFPFLKQLQWVWPWLKGLLPISYSQLQKVKRVMENTDEDVKFGFKCEFFFCLLSRKLLGYLTRFYVN